MKPKLERRGRLVHDRARGRVDVMSTDIESDC